MSRRAVAVAAQRIRCPRGHVHGLYEGPNGGWYTATEDEEGSHYQGDDQVDGAPRSRAQAARDRQKDIEMEEEDWDMEEED